MLKYKNALLPSSCRSPSSRRPSTSKACSEAPVAGQTNETGRILVSVTHTGRICEIWISSVLLSVFPSGSVTFWDQDWEIRRDGRPFSHQVAVLPLVAGRPLLRPIPKLQWPARPTKQADLGFRNLHRPDLWDLDLLSSLECVPVRICDILRSGLRD
jgi:hypothetical protein